MARGVKTPYGYRAPRTGEQPLRLVVKGVARTDLLEEPAEMAVVARIRALRATNSYALVADLLNDSGFRLRTGKPWTRQRVYEICREFDI